MRRLGLLVVFLSMLSLTTAFAASFNVQTEDITSFSSAVTIDVPFRGELFLLDPPPMGTLSTSPATSTNSVWSKSLQPGGLLPDETNPDLYVAWQTAPLSTALHVVSPVATLYITQTGQNGPITAGLADCTTAGCTQFAMATSAPTNDNLKTIDFGTFDKTIIAGHWLRLTVVNSGTSQYNLQWGYKTNRPASLVLSVPSP